MNFLNFLSSGITLLNFNLSAADRSNSLFKPQELGGAPLAKESQTETEGSASWSPRCSSEGFSKVRPLPSPSDNTNPILIPTVLPPKQKILEEIVNPLLHTISSQIITQQKELLTQYLQLNMQLFSQQSAISNTEIPVASPPAIIAFRSEEEHASFPNSDEHKNSLRKKIKKNNTCGHGDKPHYAKGMCNNCYHKYGRTKKPLGCPHEKLYAAGLCQNCYINKYNKEKRTREHAAEREEHTRNGEEAAMQAAEDDNQN